MITAGVETGKKSKRVVRRERQLEFKRMQVEEYKKMIASKKKNRVMTNAKYATTDFIHTHKYLNQS